VILQSGFQQTPQFSSSSSMPNFVLQRNTHWNVATLKNPRPGLVNRGVSSSGKMVNTMPMNLSMNKSNMKMWFGFKETEPPSKVDFNVKV
jgi:hypothetical protein